MRTRADVKKIQAIDDNFLPPQNKLINFNELINVIAKMFYLPSKKLNSSLSISDYRWGQLKYKLGPIMQFYYQELHNWADKLPKIYKFNLQQRIIKPRCYCLDISSTHYRDGQLVLWKCNACKRYLSYLPMQIDNSLKAYSILS